MTATCNFITLEEKMREKIKKGKERKKKGEKKKRENL